MIAVMPAPQIRGERLVAIVLDATMRELANAGYRALSIETVAEHAGVNKTTIYRRWPTKAELVRDALLSRVGPVFAHPDEGSLRADLLAFAKGLRDIISTPEGKGIFRVMAAESESTELGAVMSQIKETTGAIMVEMVGRAEARGEVAKGADAELIVSCVVAPILNWCQMDNREVPDSRVEQVVNLVLEGALAAKPTSSRTHFAPRPSRRRSPSPKRAAT